LCQRNSGLATQHLVLFYFSFSYKEQSSGEGGSAEEGDGMTAEDYYYEEELDDRPTVEKVRVFLM